MFLNFDANVSNAPGHCRQRFLPANLHIVAFHKNKGLSQNAVTSNFRYRRYLNLDVNVLKRAFFLRVATYDLSYSSNWNACYKALAAKSSYRMYLNFDVNVKHYNIISVFDINTSMSYGTVDFIMERMLQDVDVKVQVPSVLKI